MVSFVCDFTFPLKPLLQIVFCPSSTIKRSFEFETLSSNSFGKSVGDKGKNVCWKVSVVLTSRITFSLNLMPLHTTVSKTIVPVNFVGKFNSRRM